MATKTVERVGENRVCVCVRKLAEAEHLQREQEAQEQRVRMLQQEEAVLLVQLEGAARAQVEKHAQRDVRRVGGGGRRAAGVGGGEGGGEEERECLERRCAGPQTSCVI